MSLLDIDLHELSPLRTVGALVRITADRPSEVLRHDLERAVQGTAFRLDTLDGDGRVAQARFVLAAGGLAVSWTSLLDLAHRLDRRVEVHALERLTARDLLATV
jgi:hypothetical protein